MAKYKEDDFDWLGFFESCIEAQQGFIQDVESEGMKAAQNGNYNAVTKSIEKLAVLQIELVKLNREVEKLQGVTK